MKIEKDCVWIMFGICYGKIIGLFVILVVENKDWKNWIIVMFVVEVFEKDWLLWWVVCLCLGYVDLVGGMKYYYWDFWNVFEWFFVREMIMCVVIGVIVKKILEEFDIIVVGYVICFGGI